MRKNYFEIKEINEEIRVYKTLKFDLLVLINHCIFNHVEYENFKNALLIVEKKIEERNDILKKLVGGKNV
jgi:hypothetical protein